MKMKKNKGVKDFSTKQIDEANRFLEQHPKSTEEVMYLNSF